MSEQDKAVTAYERVRLYTELVCNGSLGATLVYDERYCNESWPRMVYALARPEVIAVLDELAALREENALQRQDIEDLTNERDDLNEMVLALRKHGGEHWYSYGYRKVADTPTGYVDYCKVCDRPQGDPSHFGNGVKALSSQDVETAVEAVKARLVRFLGEGTSMGEKTSQDVAQDLLKGLPGIPQG